MLKKLLNRVKPNLSKVLPILRIAGLALGGLLVVAVLGIVGLWGHFWNFRVGDPTADTCQNCHAMDSHVESAVESDFLIEHHTVRDVTCTDCHEQTVETQFHETVAQVTGNYDDPLPREKYDNEMCFQCHEHNSYRQLAWRSMDLGLNDMHTGESSANPHQPPHWTNMDCNLCHMVHRESKLHCAECHQFSADVP